MPDATGRRVFLAIFGGAGDGPGLFHSGIVEEVATRALRDPAVLGLGGVTLDPGSRYLEWSDAALWRGKAVESLAALRAADPGRFVLVVAHSYGCEAALRTVKDMSDVTVDHLVTIDGVSWQSRFFWDDCPANVKQWTNVYASGVHDFTDVIALVGGQWKERDGATRNIDANDKAVRGKAPAYSHASFLRMWRLALPYVRSTLSPVTI